VNNVIRFLVLLFCFESSLWCLVPTDRLCECIEAVGTLILQERPSVAYTGAFCKAMEVPTEDGTIIGVPGGGEGGGGFNPLRTSEVLTKLSQIPSSVENTSVTT
jgi:hypothetical protein